MAAKQKVFFRFLVPMTQDEAVAANEACRMIHRLRDNRPVDFERACRGNKPFEEIFSQTRGSQAAKGIASNVSARIAKAKGWVLAAFNAMMGIKTSVQPKGLWVESNKNSDPAEAGILVAALQEHYDLDPVPFTWAIIPEDSMKEIDVGGVICLPGEPPRMRMMSTAMAEEMCNPLTGATEPSARRPRRGMRP